MKVPPAIEAKILAAVGLTPAKQSEPRSVKTRAPRRFVVEVDIPIYLRSEANTGGKVAARRARVTAIKAAVLDMMPGLPFMPFPAVVTITRFGTREMDDDNLTISAKAVRDSVAARLGVDDRDKRVTWRVRQGAAFEPFVRIRVEHKEP